MVWATVLRLRVGYGTVWDLTRPVRWTEASTALVGEDGGIVCARAGLPLTIDAGVTLRMKT